MERNKIGKKFRGYCKIGYRGGDIKDAVEISLAYLKYHATH